MKKKLNLEDWSRREHFEFFKKFEEPFFGLVANVDVTKAYAVAKSSNASFFLYYLHKVAAAVNGVEAFRYRIAGDEVFVYDSVDVSATLTREDNTFGFSFMEFHEDFNVFELSAQKEIERVRNTPGLFTRAFEMDNIIHFSAIPWVNFTSLSHARSFVFPDSCPKISVGKIVEENGHKLMPVSVHVHHGLMDGYHVGLFFDLLQQELNSNV
ncbi:chloramphenicol acetyltransferase [Flavobacterium salilacus subsp. salilacus]|uniref:chloramphenicol acetyltransferase n=1 Tax=Flavobacterium TaxID=237 RepID=UPI001074D347|nr:MULTISPECIES: chloramphenicol acetyltransferase [Flavobacterium]KAF2515460.1 chloramphenicol acetyltransferase [Flavobacterium salilacus subsp. salilacus]MBE1615858.1 chloramphenicol acetyltransferase [Flavobacterium sp. SaA2.13]